MDCSRATTPRSAATTRKSWKYQLDKDGFAKVDDTLQDPNCVFQIMKAHYARYTPDDGVKVTGTPKDAFLKVWSTSLKRRRPTRP